MYGIYTIGGDEPDYENFNDAVLDITARGISDSVTFYVRPGMYSEQITIPSIDGTSESKWVTFTSDPSKSDTAVLSYTDNEDNYVINLQGATYINIQNLKLISEGYSNYESTYGRVITMSDCYYINIRNNRIIGVNDPVYLSDDNAVIFAQNSFNQFVTFDGNRIEKGSYGIFFIGFGLGDDLILGTNISNNRVSGFYGTGMVLKYLGNPLICGNKVSDPASLAYDPVGIDLSYAQDGFRMEKNQVDIQSANGDIYGIWLKHCDNSDGVRGLMANNFISVSVGNGNTSGLSMFHCVDVDVFYNSINLYGNGTGYSSCFEMDCFNSGIMFENEIFNNILSNTADGLGINYSESCNNNNYVDDCNYNAFNISGTKIASFNGSDCTNLYSWQQASGFDANSIVTDPEFYSETNLHLTGFCVVGKATAMEYIVDEDIDGDIRDIMTPDIGADEFEIPAADYDLSIYLWDIFIKPFDVSTYAGEPVTVTLMNDGIYPMSNTEVSYQVDEGDWVTETVSATIEPWDFYDYTFAEMVDLSSPGSYEIVAKLSNPQDQNPLNDYDTITVIVEPQPYCEWIYWMGCEWMYNLETVELNTLTNQWSGCSDMGFGDYTYLSTDLEQGEAYQLTIQTGADDMYVSVWIDFDDDRVFNDTNEKLVTDLYCEFGWTDYTANLLVPVSAYPSSHRMRVRSVYGISGFNACDEYSYGEAEDYSVNITS
nr:right-handed parallel beta-helix repeat-containing protein [Bacteroidota bacterium]